MPARSPSKRWRPRPTSQAIASVTLSWLVPPIVQLSDGPSPNDASEPQMARGRVHVLGMACGRTIAAAVIWRAQVRAAFNDLARNLCRRQAGIVTSLHRAAARIFRNAARLRRVGRVLGGPPVGGPFPHIADHVVDAVAVRRKRHHRRGAVEAILAFIFVRKIALPGIGAMLPTGGELVAPGEFGAVEAAARGEFPFGLGRQILARPFGVSKC